MTVEVGTVMYYKGEPVAWITKVWRDAEGCTCVDVLRVRPERLLFASTLLIRGER